MIQEGKIQRGTPAHRLQEAIGNGQSTIVRPLTGDVQDVCRLLAADGKADNKVSKLGQKSSGLVGVALELAADDVRHLLDLLVKGPAEAVA